MAVAALMQNSAVDVLMVCPRFGIVLLPVKFSLLLPKHSTAIKTWFKKLFAENLGLLKLTDWFHLYTTLSESSGRKNVEEPWAWGRCYMCFWFTKRLKHFPQHPPQNMHGTKLQSHQSSKSGVLWDLLVTWKMVSWSLTRNNFSDYKRGSRWAWDKVYTCRTTTPFHLQGKGCWRAWQASPISLYRNLCPCKILMLQSWIFLKELGTQIQLVLSSMTM